MEPMGSPESIIAWIEEEAVLRNRPRENRVHWGRLCNCVWPSEKLPTTREGIPRSKRSISPPSRAFENDGIGDNDDGADGILMRDLQMNTKQTTHFYSRDTYDSEDKCAQE